ncbi:uncharacterized protein LOC143227549 [Tachypleus tridentatus]|uniref:uncharacterized protein LOC143227549 n=1 Tax=Tachypleus tridentatus TaxID=6853 RepID=UPI003FD2E953
MSDVMETSGHESHVKHSNSPSLSALMAACQQNSEEKVKFILEKKRHLVATRDRSGKTALHYCTENKDITCADLILKTDPSLINEKDEEGYSALHLAVICGNKLMAKYLIDKGADVNSVDNELHTCIHWATVCGELDCLDILIDASGDPATPDIHGAYPIHYAAQMCGPNRETGNDVTLGLAVLHKLLARGVDVSVKDKDGRQPLLWAASVDPRPSKTSYSSESSDVIVALVNAGASVAAEDKDGLTALHCAASRGHVDCLETLINLCGAEVETIDSNGCTALFFAVTLGHADCTQLLLQHGADPNRQDRKGRTAAHCGAAKGQLETLKILESNGGNMWLPNVRGDLPLHEAVQSGRKDLVLWLLSLNPNVVNAENQNGRSPLHVAAFTDNVEICKILLDHKANINPILQTTKGQLMSPLDAAIRRGNRNCAKYLQLHGAMPASRLLENQELSRSITGQLEKAPEQKVTPSEESLSPSLDNKISQFNLESLLDERKTRSESVQTDQSKEDKRDIDVQVHMSSPDVQRGLNIVEREYYLKNSVKKTSSDSTTSRNKGENKRVRQAIITNVYVSASDDNKKKRKEKQRYESEDDETSDEDRVSEPHRRRIKRQTTRGKMSEKNTDDSDGSEVHENNGLRKTRQSRTDKIHKRMIRYIEEDSREQYEDESDNNINGQDEKREIRKDRMGRDRSKSYEDVNERELEHRNTWKKEETSETEDSPEKYIYDDKIRGKTRKVEVGNYKEYEENIKVSENKKYKITISSNEYNKKVKESGDPKRNNVQSNRQTKEIQGNVSEENSLQNENNDNEYNHQEKGELGGNQNGGNISTSGTGEFKGHEKNKSQMRSHEEKLNEIPSSITTTDLTRPSLKVIEESEIQENKENGLGQKKSTSMSSLEDTTLSLTFTKLQGEMSIEGNYNQDSPENKFTTIMDSEKKKPMLENQNGFHRENVDDEIQLNDDLEAIDGDENHNIKQRGNLLKTNREDSLLLVDNSLRQTQILATRHLSEQSDDLSVEEGEIEKNGRKRLEVVGAEEDRDIAPSIGEYKTVSSRKHVRPKDRKSNVSHVKSKLDTEALTFRNKRPSNVSSVEVSKEKPYEPRNSPSKEVFIGDAIQQSLKNRNQLERRLFEDLEELKKHQLRYGRKNEDLVVRRLANKLRKDVVAMGLLEFHGPYHYLPYEKYLFDQIRLLPNHGRMPKIKKNDDRTSDRLVRVAEPTKNPAMCTCSTYRCHHVTEIYRSRPNCLVTVFMMKLCRTDSKRHKCRG